MRDLERIEKLTYKMRQALYVVMDEKDNLLDIDVIAASQELDKALNEYNNLLNKVEK